MKQLYRHKKTGKFYNLVSENCKFEVPETGEWVDAVIYSPEGVEHQKKFSIEYDKFFEEFEFAGEELWDEDEGHQPTRLKTSRLGSADKLA